MSTPEYDFERVAEDLIAVAADVRMGDLFGVPCITTAGKAFAAFQPDAGLMAFKLLEDDERERAQALPGAATWDPKGDGRGMPDWVAVPHDQVDTWVELARQALEPYR